MATRYTKRARIIVPLLSRDGANAAAKTVDTIGGERTFTVGLSADGTGDPSHFVCDWAMTETERTRLANEFTRRGVTARIYDLDDPDPHRGRPSLDSVLTTETLKRIESTAG